MAERGGEDLVVGFGVDLGGLKEGFAGAKEEVKTGSDELKESTGGLTVGMVALGGVIAGVATELISMAQNAIKQSYDAFYQLGDSLEHMQRRLGGTMEEMSYLKAGLESVGLTTQMYEGIARRLPMILESHKEQFKAAGIAYHDAEGNLLPVTKVIENLTAHLEKSTEGAERNMEGVRLMGRGYQQMVDMFELTAERQAEATAVAREYGAVLNNEDKEATNEFGRQTALLQLALSGLALTIGRDLLPRMTAMAIEIRENLYPALMAIQLTIVALHTLFEGLSYAVFVVIEIFGLMAARAALVAEILLAVTSLDGERLKRAWKAWEDVGIAAMDNVVARAKKMREDLQAVVEDQFGPKTDEPAKLARDPHANDVSAGKLAMAEQMAARELALTKQTNTALSEANESLHKQQLIDDKEYWVKKLEIEQAGIDAELKKARSDKASAGIEAKQAFDKPEARDAANAKAAAAETRIQVLEMQRADAAVKNQHDMFAAVEQRTRKAEQVEIEHSKKMSLSEIDAKMETINQLKALGQIDATEALTATSKLEMDKLAIEREALVKKRELHGDWTTEYKEIQKQIQLLDTQTANKRVELDNKAALDQRKHWDSFFGSLKSGFQSVIANFLNGVATIGDTIRGMFQAIAGGIVNVLAQIAAEWLVSKLLMLTTDKATGAAQLTTQVALAGAGGTASMAAAPWPLNMTAPAFGSAMAAGAAAWGALMAAPGFAVGSWDVPDDMFTKIHKGEMIVPAEFAENMRGGGGMGGGTVNFNVSAVDAKSVQQFFKDNGRAIANSMRNQGRNFYPV